MKHRSNMAAKVLVLTLALLGVALGAKAADVNVSVSVGHPGFYGHIDIGDYPRPTLLFAKPVLIHRVAVAPAPIYLHVPPGHAKDWGKHCGRYNACGRSVYFVDERWYNNVYVPRYQERHGKGAKHNGVGPAHKDKSHGKGNGKSDGHGNGKNK